MDSQDPTTDTTHAPQATGATGAAYWRSLDELADTEQFRSFVDREFPSYAPQMMLSSTRRQFLKVMGASVALAGLVGCRRWPRENVAPYNRRPEDQDPGEFEYFATAFERRGVAEPLVVTSVDGRPIKIEGNAKHPASNGASSMAAQASILALYDPHRLRGVRQGAGEQSRPQRWPTFQGWLDERVAAAGANAGAGLAVLMPETSSPTMHRLIGRMRSAMPEASVVMYQPGAATADGKAATDAVRPIYDLAEARTIVSFGSDFLTRHPDQIRLARQFADSRAVDERGGTMSRLWVVESEYSVTGSNADERLARRPAEIEHLVGQVLLALDPARAKEVSPEARRIAADLRHAGRHAAVFVGESLSPQTRNLVHEIHRRLGAIGHSVDYHRTERPEAASVVPDGTKLLIMLGGNPMYDGSADLIASIDRVPEKVHLSDYANETSVASTWRLPRAHYLESWGDARDWAGVVTVQQPLILPLFDAFEPDGTPITRVLSDIEMMLLLLGEKPDGQAAVRATYDGASADQWRQALHEGYVPQSTYPAVDAAALPGGRPVGPPTERSEAFDLLFTADPKVGFGEGADNGWLQELPDPLTRMTWDNPALVSIPDALRMLGKSIRKPDLSGLKGAALAKAEQSYHAKVAAAVQPLIGRMLRIEAGGQALEVPALPVPGQAEGVITLRLGYGRVEAGPVGRGVGFDCYPLMRAAGSSVATGATVTLTGGTYDLANVQNHYAIDTVGFKAREKRATEELVRTATLAEYKHNPDFTDAHTHLIPLPQYGRVDPEQDRKMREKLSKPADGHGGHGEKHGKGHDAGEPAFGFTNARQIQPFDNVLENTADQTDHQWGMTVDLNRCIGCGACVVACQAENNVPIVGKEQVRMSREMHWLRIDRYFTGNPAEPDTVRSLHQPMMCVHCENAPCETVCPVAATVHDSEGLNVMVYNRCIGTRYCSNNCPYKVRRFNYFDWNANDPTNKGFTPPFLGIPDQEQVEEISEIRKLGFNPEVTVRMRGVMEKCTYCIQRIQNAKQAARVAFLQDEAPNDMVQDGAVQTACQQSCATHAIVFGNLKDEQSRVHRLQYSADRAYTTLEHLNIRPRTKYLARITNPVDQGEGYGHGHGDENEHHGHETEH